MLSSYCTEGNTQGMPGEETRDPGGRFASLTRWGRRLEDSLAALILLAMAVLPVIEMGLRAAFNTGVPGSSRSGRGNLTLSRPGETSAIVPFHSL